MLAAANCCRGCASLLIHKTLMQYEKTQKLFTEKCGVYIDTPLSFMPNLSGSVTGGMANFVIQPQMEP